MALTPAERVSLFEILEIPSTEKIYTLDAFLGAGRQAATIAIQSAVNAVDEVLAMLDAAQEQRLKDYIAKWDQLSTDSVEIAEGGASVAPGLRYSSEKERALIRQRVLDLVPVFREILWKLRMAGADIGLAGAGGGGALRRG